MKHCIYFSEINSGNPSEAALFSPDFQFLLDTHPSNFHNVTLFRAHGPGCLTRLFITCTMGHQACCHNNIVRVQLDAAVFIITLTDLMGKSLFPFLAPLNKIAPRGRRSGSGAHIPLCFNHHAAVDYHSCIPFHPNSLKAMISCTYAGAKCPARVYSGIDFIKLPRKTVNIFHEPVDGKSLIKTAKLLETPYNHSQAMHKLCNLNCVEIPAGKEDEILHVHKKGNE